MQPLPHVYTASISCTDEDPIHLSSPGLPALETAPPAEFGGPGDRWSPETLLLAAVVDCYALTFRAVAAASKLEWHGLECTVSGVLDRADGKTQFTEIQLTARLNVPPEVKESTAQRLLEKAEHNCLISNSLNAQVSLQTAVLNQASAP